MLDSQREGSQLHRWEKESSSEKLEEELHRYLGDIIGPIAEPVQDRLVDRWEPKVDRDFNRPWWATLDSVYFLEYYQVGCTAGPVGVYVNRTELGGKWSDIIVGWEREEDAERHKCLLEADMDDPTLEVRVVEMEPMRLAVISLETDSLLDVQRGGSLLMPPERMVGSVEDMRSSFERAFSL